MGEKNEDVINRALKGEYDTDGGGRKPQVRAAARDAAGQLLNGGLGAVDRLVATISEAEKARVLTLEDATWAGELADRLAAISNSLPNPGRLVATRLRQSSNHRAG